MMTSKNLFLIEGLLIILTLLLVACQAIAPQPAHLPTETQMGQGARLRITNSGSTSIQGLVVLFPKTRIAFRNIPAGATTEYLMVENGVYNYAAYQYIHNGETITQPVIETGRTQGDYTYVVTYTPDMMRITLVEVKVD